MTGDGATEPERRYESSRELLARMLRLYAPRRGRVALLLATIVALSGLGVANPLLTKVVFDRALFPSEEGPDLALLVLLASAMAAVVAVTGALGVLQTYLAASTGHGVIHDLREQLYVHLQRMSLRFFTSTQTGEIQSRIAQDVGGVGTVIGGAGVSIVANALFVGVSLAAMALLAWPLMLVSLAVLPVFVYLSHRVGKRGRELTRSAQRTAADMSVITQETLSVSGALLTKVFDRQAEAADRFRMQSRRLADLRLQQAMTGRVTLGLAQTFFLLTPVVVYLIAGFLLAGGSPHLTAGTLVAFTALQVRLFVPARDLMENWISIQSSLAMFERIFEYLDLPHEIVDAPGAKVVSREAARGQVGFRNVSFQYRREVAGLAVAGNGGGSGRILEDVNLVIEPGSLAAIVGPSGAGKTTMAYLVARLYDVDRGAVEIDGIDIREISLASLAQIVGMVTQETYLVHASVRENLLYARPEASPADVEAACRAAHIHERILELDDGYDTVVGERGYRMSGGERQRLAIARALLKDPRILILDEATSSLDTTSERLVQRALDELMAGRTTIAIAHRLSTIRRADTIFVLERGRLVEQGTHTALVARGGRYARLYEQQFHAGLVESRCEDGIVLSTGEIVRTDE